MSGKIPSTKFEIALDLKNNIQELSNLAIQHIEDRANQLRHNGIYGIEQQAKDEALLHFFKNWAEAETRYWLNDRKQDGFLQSFLKRYPWFDKRTRGILKLLGFHS